MKIAAHSTTLLSLMLLLSGVGSAVQAQQVYRSVGPDGRVTFSDRPPVEAKSQATAETTGTQAASSANDNLPYALRQVASRFPVTLYTGADCAPCASARSLLTGRGVPFSERTVTSNDDIDALKRLSGATSLPFGTIGAQQLSGFAESEWTQYLDAAGYPKQSQLPANYRRPPAQPLVPAAAKSAAPAEAASRDRSAAPRPRNEAPRPAPAANPSNPAGISF